jgi:hypothetical protein
VWERFKGEKVQGGKRFKVQGSRFEGGKKYEGCGIGIGYGFSPRGAFCL